MVWISFVLGMLSTIVLASGFAWLGGKYIQKHPEIIVKKATRMLFNAPSNLHK